MGFSRRKPYQYPKDSHFTFMRRRVRWLKDLLTKESLFEKPYLSDGRAEMHMEMPSFVFPQFPPYPEYTPFPEIKYPPPYDRYIPRVWSYPPLPTKDGQQPTGSVSTFPTPKKTEQWPSLTSSVPPGNSWTGFRIVPYCDVDYRLSDCAEEGDVFTIRAQAQYYSDSLEWKAVSSNHGEVDVFLVSTHWGSATFGVVVRKEITEEVSICIMFSMYDHSFRKTFKLDCGCIEIESCLVCPADPNISWDYSGSIETIARNASGTVAVSGGKGPYAWSVSGTGFTLDNATTAGKSNSLNADGTACGSAEITVTDACGEVATGYVRCTTGTWSLQGNQDCYFPGVSYTEYTEAPAERYTKILNNKKTIIDFIVQTYCGGYDCGNPDLKDCVYEGGCTGHGGTNTPQSDCESRRDAGGSKYPPWACDDPPSCIPDLGFYVAGVDWQCNYIHNIADCPSQPTWSEEFVTWNFINTRNYLWECA